MALSSNTDLETVKRHILDSDNWGSSQFKFSDLSRPISQIHFAAHANVENLGDHAGGEDVSPTNHWSLFLSTGPNSSVQLDVVPNDLGRPGMVILESKTLGFSDENDIIKSISIDVPTGTTVAKILNLIISKHRDYYVFMRLGEGCRYWLWTLAEDFVDENLIKKEDVGRVHTSLVKYWPYPPGTPPVDREMAKGVFAKSAHGNSA